MIPVIDLFAGPGGLGEGFCALRYKAKPVFKIALSIEKESTAHKTLVLRSFFRQFKRGKDLSDYYAFVRGEISLNTLFRRHPEQARNARSEALRAELGKRNPRNVDARIRTALGCARNWLLIGGPPCQAYSLAGRARMRPKHSRKFANDERHVLYREYLRIIVAHRPPVFVMENVKGLLSSTHEKQRTVELILRDLRDPLAALPSRTQNELTPLSYELYAITPERKLAKPRMDKGRSRPEQFLVRCEDHGIPQSRHRIIIVGVRSDIGSQPPSVKARASVPLWKAISNMPQIRSRLSDGRDSPKAWVSAINGLSRVLASSERERQVRAVVRRYLKQLRARRNTGAEFTVWRRKPDWNCAWFYDAQLGGVLHHSGRSHMPSDLMRYFYAASFAKLHRRSPRVSDFPRELLPDHKNVKHKSGNHSYAFADRFRVQLRHTPATTVTSHIGKDGHYFIHPDPLQCRSLTVREAARLQTFPDNYFFFGGRTEQYHQVGNAVPPLLARQIASLLHTFLRGR